MNYGYAGVGFNNLSPELIDLTRGSLLSYNQGRYNRLINLYKKYEESDFYQKVEQNHSSFTLLLV